MELIETAFQWGRRRGSITRQVEVVLIVSASGGPLKGEDANSPNRRTVEGGKSRQGPQWGKWAGIESDYYFQRDMNGPPAHRGKSVSTPTATQLNQRDGNGLHLEQKLLRRGKEGGRVPFASR